jgi:hypothetical protein
VSSAICSVPTATCIQSLINALFRPGDQLRSANSHWANIQTKVRQQRFRDAQAKATDLVTFGFKSFYAGKLLGGMNQPTPDNLAALTTALYQFACLALPPAQQSACQASAPVISPEALDEDGAAAVITPQSPTTLVITGTKDAGVLVPAGAAPEVTVVSIARLPDSPGPLLTSLDQFPLFYEFNSSPEVTFLQFMTIGVCQSQDFNSSDETLPNYADLRLAHNVGTNFGDIEILPRVDAPFLDCPPPGSGDIGTLKLDGLPGLAATGWNFFGRTVGPLAKAVFLPDELHATALGTCCLGGSSKKFSPHGAVDPGSNPGSLGIVDENGDPTSGEVSGPGTVYVKTTSKNGDPIQNVPVTFDGETTVLTNADGIASFVWDATPGTSLIASVPDETIFEGEGFSCPNDIPEPTPNSAYRPLVCFTPSSVTFTSPLDVTPVSSSLQLIASSQADGVLVGDTDEASQAAALDQLSVAVNALATNGDVSVETEGSAVATWQSAQAGQVVFSELGWTTVGAAGEGNHAVLFNGTDWTYTFTANRSGTFSLDYDVTIDQADPDDFGLQGFTFSWAEGTGGLQFQRFFCVNPSRSESCEPTTTGTVTKSVVAGTQYTVRVENAANVFGPFTRTEYMSATFDWSITPAPIILVQQSVRSPSTVVAPLGAMQLQCKGTERRVCTRVPGRQR